MLNINKKTGDTLTAAEVNAIGAAVDKLDTDLVGVNKAIDNVNKFMDSWKFQFPMCGFARVHGDVDPNLTTLYNSDQIKELGKHMRIMTVKDGVIQHVAARGRLTLATNGDTIPLDGSDGDIMVGFDVPIYQLKATKMVDGVKTDCVGVGLGPASWNGVLTKEQPKFAVTPWETVNCQLAGDVRTQAHCIYNKNVAGYSSSPGNLFNEVVKPNGNGYPSQGVSGVQSILQAQAKNKDAQTVFPYMGDYYEFEEIIRTMMYAECQTLNTSNINVMGCGQTRTNIANSNTFNDSAISANSGVKIVLSSGTVEYKDYYSEIKDPTGANKQIVSGINSTAWISTTECGESVRVLDAIVAAGLQNKIGSNTNIFTFDSAGHMTCISDGSVNIDTGAGMKTTQRYYIVRNVPKCEGLADGVLTAVVNCYFKTTFKAGVKNTAGNVSYDGATCIFKFSHSVYRGWCIPLDGTFRQMGYAYSAIMKQNGKLTNKYYAAESVYDVQPIKNPSIYGKIGTLFDAIKGLKLVKDNVVFTGGWQKSADYNVSMFCFDSAGGGEQSCECSYLWQGACWGEGESNGQPAEGMVSLQASAVGCDPAYAVASARTLFSRYALGSGSSSYAGAFAVLLQPKA